ncbi:MAG TPA: adenylate/guanylate cyclase domain-containing protein, partial [Acidobacteriota bacterium]|nr:adenylate/guanylate cyclase domain-containing protein [Acidobacteriota bacterium]
MRRHVTVAVSQLNGYAELIESLSPAEAQSFLQTLRQNLEETVKRHEGIVCDFSGDQIVIVYGIPSVQEDDALRALRTALEIHSEIRELSSQVERRIRRPLLLQSGITSGVSVAELTHGPQLKCNITGNILQLASRLAAEAEEDQILISPECRRLIDPYFETEPLEGIRLKGKGASIVPYRVLKESGVQSRLEASARSGFTAFAGREKELQMLQSVWKKVQQNEGHLVTVFGEAGIGKSRLLLEFTNQLASSSVLVLRGRCHSHRSKIPYVPFVGALRELLQFHENESLSAETVVARILQIDASLETFLPIYLYLLSIKSDHHVLPKHLQAEDLRLAVREALSAIFTIKAAEITTVLQLEDWHWSDDA